MSRVFTPALENFVSYVLDAVMPDAMRRRGLVPTAALLYGEEYLLFQLGEPEASLPWAEHLPLLRAQLRELAHDPEGEVPDAVAVAYDTVLTDDGERTDAVGVEAHEPGAEHGVFVAQKYRPGSRLKRGRQEGNTLVLRVDLPPLV